MKLTFAFDNWSDEYEWWIPNGTNKFEPSNIPAYGPYWFVNNEVQRHDFCTLHNNVTYKHINELSSIESYIYPIIIKSVDYFKLQNLHGCITISNKVLNDVKSGLAKLMFIFPFEGTSCTSGFENDFEILDSWLIKLGFNKEHKCNIFYLHGNLNPNKFSNMFTYIPICIFSTWIHDYIKKPFEYKPTSSKNLFLMYNRNARFHRILTILKLMKANLYKRGMISYAGDVANKKHAAFVFNDNVELSNFADALDNITPINLDIVNLHDVDPFHKLQINHYESTFLSIVSETHFENSCLFISEKTWKAIAAGHPFIMLCSQYSLKYLKSLGYKTFDKWWNEDYDEELDLNIKIDKILDILHKLSLKTLIELNVMKLEMYDIVDYNLQLFWKLRHIDNRYTNPDDVVYKTIQNILINKE